MPYGFDVAVPTTQPSDLTPAKPSAEAPEMSFGTAMGMEAPPVAQPPEPSLGEVFFPPQQKTPTAPMPDRFGAEQLRQLQDVRQKQEQQDLLNKIEGEISGVERIERDEIDVNEEVDATLQNIAKLLGPNPVPNDQFKGQETFFDQVSRFKKDPVGFFSDSFKENIARARAGLGKTDEQKLKGFSGAWNDPKTGASVAWKQGEPWIKYPNSNGYVKVGGKKWKILEDFFLDNTRPILEMIGGMAGQAPFDAAAIAAAELPGGGIAAPALAGMGAAVGGAASEYLPHLAQKSFDAIYGNNQMTPEEEKAIHNDALFSAGLSVATLGLMKGAGVGGRFAKEQLGDIFNAKNRMYRLDEIKQYYARFVDTYSEGKSKGDITAAGKEMFGAVDSAINKMKATVESVESTAKQLAGKDAKFSMTNTISKLKQTLEDYGATIDPETGKVTLPDAAAFQVADDAKKAAKGSKILDSSGRPIRSDSAQEIVDASEMSAKAAQAELKPAFGQIDGRKELEKMSTIFEQMYAAEKGGGLSLPTMLNYLDAFKFEGDLDKVIARPTQLTETYRALRNSSTMDRAEALKGVFAGTNVPEKAIFEKAYEQFHKNIDDHLDFAKLFNSQKSAADFAKRVAGDKDYIELLERVLGPSSDYYKRFKGEYLGNMIDESIDPNTGIFKGKQFIEKMTKMPKEVRSKLFSDQQFKDLLAMARASQKVGWADFVPDNATKENLVNLIGGFGSNAFLTTRVRAVMAMTGRNYEAMKWLTEEGMFEAMRKRGVTASERRSMLAAQRYMEEMMNSMRVVSAPRVNENGVKKYVKVLVPKAFKLNAAREGVQKVVEPPPQDKFLQGGVPMVMPQVQPGT